MRCMKMGWIEMCFSSQVWQGLNLSRPMLDIMGARILVKLMEVVKEAFKAHIDEQGGSSGPNALQFYNEDETKANGSNL